MAEQKKSLPLNGKTALVTGGGRGIGRAIACALAEAGADVAIVYRSNEAAAYQVRDAIRSLGRRGVALHCDVSRSAEVSAAVEGIHRELGAISIVVNNAGIAQMRTMDEITEGDWDEVLAVNLKGAFLVTQASLPGMRGARWGRIISISSVAAQVGGVVGMHYAASKAGIIGLTHYYAAYLANEGITANAIAPGAIDTEMAAALPLLKPESVPVGRLGTAEEIAAVAVMLACNGYITGQTINVNGGRYPG
ncbi:SDR family oxidoreductase [Geomonas sp. RF6]|uniref:SDR family oxidoreductase n=1 Tax=Geomonas sp. RF6 TaxID=2897342 RepID=UPI001E3FAA9E|nr:SDR family NAD(P)-dependent oxidoreductase [Geomonas sp. RF6]UFS70459.1 SDR family oxidoreductase [Geomonas sp. RF6]